MRDYFIRRLLLIPPTLIGITLILVPVCYLLLEDLIRLFRPRAVSTTA